MIQEHIVAVRALLVAGGLVYVPPNATPPGAGTALYDGQVPKQPRFPYVVMWSTPGDLEQTSFADDHSDLDARLYTTAVAETAEAARLVMQQVRDLLDGVRPVVAGRDCWKLRVSYSEPIREDRDVTLPGSSLHPMYGIDAWRLGSVPA